MRIAVNEELEALTLALPDAFDALAAGGRLLVISFHSLEDRIVKRFMKAQASGPDLPPDLPVRASEIPKPAARLITRKGITASETETETNPRSRSARLRIIEKLPRD